MASSSWERRNERARELGYESYYHYRTAGYGSRPPSAERPSGEELARLRGHRGGADLRADVAAGRVAHVDPLESRRDPKTGQIREVALRVTYRDGRQRTFRVRGSGLRGDRAARLRRAVIDAGIPFVAAYVLSPAWSAAAAA